MTTPAQNMRKALKTYLDAVEGTLTELSELEELAEVFSDLLPKN